MMFLRTALHWVMPVMAFFLAQARAEAVGPGADSLLFQVRATLDELSAIDPEQAIELRRSVDEAARSAPLAERDLALQQSMDPACLLEVGINPESRVKVAAENTVPRLVAGTPRACLIKVYNEAAVTAPLRITSPQAAASEERGGADKWLRLDLLNSDALPRELSGMTVEYRIVQLSTDAVGYRAALIAVDVGQGTADIGFRSDVLLTFRCGARAGVR